MTIPRERKTCSLFPTARCLGIICCHAARPSLATRSDAPRGGGIQDLDPGHAGSAPMGDPRSSEWLVIEEASTAARVLVLDARSDAQRRASCVHRPSRPGFSWTRDCERILAGGVSRWRRTRGDWLARREPGGRDRCGHRAPSGRSFQSPPLAPSSRAT